MLSFLIITIGFFCFATGFYFPGLITLLLFSIYLLSEWNNNRKREKEIKEWEKKYPSSPIPFWLD